jgi:hypothetical protein
MPNPSDRPRTGNEDVQAKVEAAWAMIRALCHGDRKWIMSIPARRDHDPDLVISDALAALLAENARLEAALAEARKDWGRAVVALAVCATPYHALLSDKESRKWIAPMVWQAMEAAVLEANTLIDAARHAGAEEGGTDA